MKASWRQSKKIHQMMKECKGEFLYFEKLHLNFGLLYYGSEGVLFFDDNDNNNTLLILKYNVKTTTLFYSKKLLKIDKIFICVKCI